MTICRAEIGHDHHQVTVTVWMLLPSEDHSRNNPELNVILVFLVVGSDGPIAQPSVQLRCKLDPALGSLRPAPLDNKNLIPPIISVKP